MPGERLEVRLDAGRRLKLTRMAEERGVPVSRLVRDIIDEAYEGSLREERLRAALELGELTIEDVPEPEVVSRQLEGAHELPDIR